MFTYIYMKFYMFLYHRQHLTLGAFCTSYDNEDRVDNLFAKETYSSAKEPYLSAKEPHLHGKKHPIIISARFSG